MIAKLLSNFFHSENFHPEQYVWHEKEKRLRRCPRLIKAISLFTLIELLIETGIIAL